MMKRSFAIILGLASVLGISALIATAAEPAKAPVTIGIQRIEWEADGRVLAWRLTVTNPMPRPLFVRNLSIKEFLANTSFTDKEGTVWRLPPSGVRSTAKELEKDFYLAIIANDSSELTFQTDRLKKAGVETDKAGRECARGELTYKYQGILTVRYGDPKKEPWTCLADGKVTLEQPKQNSRE